MKTLLVANRKGGVGKTTTAIAISTVLSMAGKRVLVVDLDTQGHLQFGIGINKASKGGIHRAMIKNDVTQLVGKTSYKNLSIIPASINFDTSELANDKTVLAKLLKNVENDFDVCIIDSPPTSDILVNSAMLAADFVITPMQTEYLSLVGTVQFLKLFYQNAKKTEKKFKFLGVVPTMYNSSIVEHKNIIEELKNIIGENKILQSIRKDIKVSESFRGGKPIFYTNEHSRGKDDYLKLVESIRHHFD